MLYLWKQVFGCISCYFDVRTNSACLLKHSHPWGIPYPSVRLWLKSLYVHIHIGESIPGNSKAKGTNANVSFLFQHNFFFIAKLIREKHLNLLSCYHMEMPGSCRTKKIVIFFYEKPRKVKLVCSIADDRQHFTKNLDFL